MVVSTYSGSTTCYKYNYSICRIPNSSIYLFVILMKRCFLIISKYVNTLIVGLLLSFVYILIIIPYHFFLRKNKGQWIHKGQELDVNFKHMW